MIAPGAPQRPVRVRLIGSIGTRAPLPIVTCSRLPRVDNCYTPRGVSRSRKHLGNGCRSQERCSAWLSPSLCGEFSHNPPNPRLRSHGWALPHRPRRKILTSRRASNINLGRRSVGPRSLGDYDSRQLRERTLLRDELGQRLSGVENVRGRTCSQHGRQWRDPDRRLLFQAGFYCGSVRATPKLAWRQPTLASQFGSTLVRVNRKRRPQPCAGRAAGICLTLSIGHSDLLQRDAESQHATDRDQPDQQVCVVQLPVQV